MVIFVRCQNSACRKPLKVKSENAGKRLKCPACGGLVQTEMADPSLEAGARGEANDGFFPASMPLDGRSGNAEGPDDASKPPAKRGPPPLPFTLSPASIGFSSRQAAAGPPPIPKRPSLGSAAAQSVPITPTAPPPILTSRAPHSAPEKSARLRWATFGTCIVASIALAYSLLRPLTPREVCEKVTAAKSVAEAEPFVSRSVRALLSDLFRQRLGVRPSTESTEWLGEEDAPPHLGGRYVYCRSRSWDSVGGDSDVGRMAFYVVKTDAWRIEDVFVLEMNGRAFEPPVSLVAAHRQGAFGTPLGDSPPAPAASSSKKSIWKFAIAWTVLRGIAAAGVAGSMIGFIATRLSKWKR
jgi:hypothetical protein